MADKRRKTQSEGRRSRQAAYDEDYYTEPRRRTRSESSGRSSNRSAGTRSSGSGKTKSSGANRTKSSDTNRTRSSGGRPRNAAQTKRRRKRRWPVWKKIVLTLLIVLILLIAAGVVYAASKFSLLRTGRLDTDQLNISDEIELDGTGYLNVALFGLDTRAAIEEMGTRSDTIMVASLNRETKEVKISSIYRDTVLQQDDGSYNKANAAYSYGGAEEAVAMLNKNLDLDIQHYLTVDFSAMVDVINELGGVDIDVMEEEIYYINGYGAEITENTGVTTAQVTETGMQTLDGVQATAYARIRYTEGDDFKRAERQRTVLTKMVEKIQTANLSTLNKIIDKVFPKVETNFTLPEILAYAKNVKDYELGSTQGFPDENITPTLDDIGSAVVADTLASNVSELHGFLFGEAGYTPSSTVREISDEIDYMVGNVGTDSTWDPYSDENTYSDYSMEGGNYSEPVDPGAGNQGGTDLNQGMGY